MSRRSVRVAVAVTSATVAVMAMALPQAVAYSATWTRVSSIPSSAHLLDGVACISARVCFAVGDDGTIVATKDADAPSTDTSGPRWATMDSGTTSNFTAISCVPSACFAVNDSSANNFTGPGVYKLGRDGRWQPTKQSDEADWVAISCPSASTCYAVANGPLYTDTTGTSASAIEITKDGGATWSLQNAPLGGQPLTSVNCPTTTFCVAGGGGGSLIRTTDAGATWTVDPFFAGVGISGISCVPVRRSPITCLAALYDNSGNDVLANTAADTNGTWGYTAQPSSNHAFLTAISCVGTRFSAVACFAVGGFDSSNPGNAADVVMTANGGRTWNSQVSNYTPPAGQPAPAGVGLDAVTCSTRICQAVGGEPGPTGVPAIIDNR